MITPPQISDRTGISSVSSPLQPLNCCGHVTLTAVTVQIHLEQVVLRLHMPLTRCNSKCHKRLTPVNASTKTIIEANAKVESRSHITILRKTLPDLESHSLVLSGRVLSRCNAICRLELL